MKGMKYFVFVFVAMLVTHCASNIFAARYYRLLEHERVLYLGLMGIDTTSARVYLNLESPGDRSTFYENYWMNRGDERAVFEQRSKHAYAQFGRSAPLSDDRIPVYVKYGEPRREIITPEKRIGVNASLVINPAEVWTYYRDGLMFDFVRVARSYELISMSQFGDSVRIPHLKEIASDTIVEIRPEGSLDFMVAYGRFRQQRNLTRLEIYMGVPIEDTTGFRLYREIRVYNKRDSLVCDLKHILQPEHAARGLFVDESNLWLRPEEYRVEVSLTDMRDHSIGTREAMINLVEYQDDVKEISDLIVSGLIDRSFTHEKFEKPVGRVIPLLETTRPVHRPFYLYAEAYNLMMQDGMHQLRTTYEVYNKERMRQEVVDVMIKDWIEPGDIAFLGAEYHPMDLVPGNYMIVLKVTDLLSGKERSAVAELKLIEPD